MRTRSLAILAGVAVAGAGLWRSFLRVEVTGSSMRPTLLPGDRLVVVALPFGSHRWPDPGEIVALRDPRQSGRILVKRVATTDRRAGTIEVLGDDRRTSTDSRSFGPVPRTSIVGRAVYRYAPSWRRGHLRAPGEYHRSR